MTGMEQICSLGPRAANDRSAGKRSFGRSDAPFLDKLSRGEALRRERRFEAYNGELTSPGLRICRGWRI